MYPNVRHAVYDPLMDIQVGEVLWLLPTWDPWITVLGISVRIGRLVLSILPAPIGSIMVYMVYMLTLGVY